MRSTGRQPARSASKAEPFRVHIENEVKLMPVFTVYPKQYEAALKRHPDVAGVIETTWGIDGDLFDQAIRNADAMVGYRFPRQRLAEKAPRLKLVQVLGAGVDYMLPFDWVPKGLVLTTNCGAHVPKAAQSALMAILMANAQIPKLTTAQRRKEWNRIFTPTVAGKTLLIVGVGHIGGGAAEQAKQLGMRVIGIRRSKKPSSCGRRNARRRRAAQAAAEGRHRAAQHRADLDHALPDGARGVPADEARRGLHQHVARRARRSQGAGRGASHRSHRLRDHRRDLSRSRCRRIRACGTRPI